MKEGPHPNMCWVLRVNEIHSYCLVNDFFFFGGTPGSAHSWVCLSDAINKWTATVPWASQSWGQQNDTPEVKTSVSHRRGKARLL